MIRKGNGQADSISYLKIGIAPVIEDRASINLLLLSIQIRLATAPKDEHKNPEEQKRQAPPQVHINPKCLFIDGGIVARGQAEGGQDRSHHRKHHSQRDSRIVKHFEFRSS